MVAYTRNVETSLGLSFPSPSHQACPVNSTSKTQEERSSFSGYLTARLTDLYFFNKETLTRDHGTLNACSQCKVDF